MFYQLTDKLVFIFQQKNLFGILLFRAFFTRYTEFNISINIAIFYNANEIFVI